MMETRDDGVFNHDEADVTIKVASDEKRVILEL